MVIFQGIPTTEVDVIFVLRNIFYQPIYFDQYIFSLCMNFILPTILSIQMIFMSLKNISDHSNLEKSLYLILLPYLHITTLTLSCLSFFQNWEKNHLQNPLNKQLVFFLFYVLKQVFCFSWIKQFKKNQNCETGKIRNFFVCFLSRSPLFSASKPEKSKT